MLAGIVAALLGPEVGQRYSAVDGLPLYVGSFLGLAGLLTISLLILLLFYRDANVVNEVSEGEIRPAQVIFKQPKLILAIVSAAMAYSIMSLIMTATPVSSLGRSLQTVLSWLQAMAPTTPTTSAVASRAAWTPRRATTTWMPTSKMAAAPTHLTTTSATERLA